jgi:hypothetical protein
MGSRNPIFPTHFLGLALAFFFAFGLALVFLAAGRELFEVFFFFAVLRAAGPAGLAAFFFLAVFLAAGLAFGLAFGFAFSFAFGRGAGFALCLAGGGSISRGDGAGEGIS